MRWLIVLAFATTTAHAHRGMTIPRIVHGCPSGASWPQVAACLEKIGFEPVIVATLDDAKLVELTLGEPRVLEGFAVYRNHGGWHFMGFLGQAGLPEDFTVKRFEHVLDAYRFDVASTRMSSTSTNGVSSVPAIYRQITSAFCTGSGWRCTTVVPHCEQIVNGQTIAVYAGTLTVHDHTFSLKGNGTVPACAADLEGSF